MTSPDLDALLALAVDAAHEAGRLLLDGRPAQLSVSTKTSPTDVVTQMDTASEELLTARLLGARPDDGLLGEEGGGREGTSGVRWVVDPVDGTVNYLYDLPVWAVSVAAEVDGRSVVGVVHAPVLGTTFTAVLGGGAFRDGERLSVSGQTRLDRSLVATGFGYEAARRAVQGTVVAALLPRVRDVRRIGSAALDLCFVGSGQVDAYYERGTHLWDVAAGSLVVTEAGGRVAGLDGAPAGDDMVVAATPSVFDELHDALVGLDAARG